MSRPFRKLTLDVHSVETTLPWLKLFEWQRMASGDARLVITVPQDAPELFRALAKRLAPPIFLLYVLHTPRGEGARGRYQSPRLDSSQVEGFLTDFTAFLAGDGRHDLWVHSSTDGRTLIWDRHDLIFAEGQPLEDLAVALEEMGFHSGVVPRAGEGDHIHYYRPEFDREAAAILARFDWSRSDLRPEDEQ